MSQPVSNDEMKPLIGCALILIAMLLFVWAGRTFGWAWW